MLSSLYEYSHKSLWTGDVVDFSQYKGKVLLIVNTASKCGFTYQYESLERIYLENKDKKFEILGFPSDDFLHQEPGNDAEIANTCKVNFGVTFPMFTKSHVKGKQQNSLYEWLTAQKGFEGSIGWNFAKFLINRDGEVVARFPSNIKPENSKVMDKLKELL
jgi:glutathione peroxidase